MKKFIYLSVSLFVFFGSFLSMCLAQGESNTKINEAGNFIANPVDVLNSVAHNANKYKSEQVQNTKYNGIQSKCGELSVDSRFTITATLCNIKENSKIYLQYVIYIGLTVATILIIRNGFKLVTAGGKEIKNFQKNIIYIIIGVLLLLSFYRILDAIVAFVNLVAE